MTEEERAFLRRVSDWLTTPRTRTTNPDRAKLLEEVLAQLRDMLSGSLGESCIEVERPSLPVGDVIINVEADAFTITDVPRFCAVVGSLRNFEVLPLPNGRVRFAAIFPDLETVAPCSSQPDETER